MGAAHEQQENLSATSNRLHRYVADLVGQTLEAHRDKIIDDTVISSVKDQLESCDFELVDLSGIGSLLGFTRQRAQQLQTDGNPPLPEPATFIQGASRPKPAWLKSDLMTFSNLRTKHFTNR